MPIRVQDELPAVNFLREENVFVMTASRATGQEIRPLKVLILNLMPKKIETENQFLRLLSNSPLQVDIQLLRIDARESRNTPSEHLNNFYCNFDDIQGENFDGLIVTGAPLGLVEFNDVAYWPQIKQVLEWAKDHVTSTLFVCWAVQAALNILYGIIVVGTRDGSYRFDSVYPALGSDAHSELAHQVGARLSPVTRCITVDSHQRTSVPGLYAAGDVVIGLDQISHAMGEGGVAATTIRNDLAALKPLLR